MSKDGLATLASDIENCAGEPLTHAAIGWFDGYPRREGPKDGRIPDDQIGVLLDWATARPLLSYDFDRGYGAPDCHPVFAWSENWVVVVTEYDGAILCRRIPRSPMALLPDFL